MERWQSGLRWGGVKQMIKKSLTTMNLTWSGICCALGDDWKRTKCKAGFKLAELNWLVMALGLCLPVTDESELFVHSCYQAKMRHAEKMTCTLSYQTSLLTPSWCAVPVTPFPSPPIAPSAYWLDCASRGCILWLMRWRTGVFKRQTGIKCEGKGDKEKANGKRTSL